VGVKAGVSLPEMLRLPVTWSILVATGSLGAVTYDSRWIIRIFGAFYSSKNPSFFVVGVSVSLVVPPRFSPLLSLFHLGCLSSPPTYPPSALESRLSLHDVLYPLFLPLAHLQQTLDPMSSRAPSSHQPEGSPPRYTHRDVLLLCLKPRNPPRARLVCVLILSSFGPRYFPGELLLPDVDTSIA
jgi:hypothetical protein